ncbi:MAG: hypothetical protein JOZ15_17715, partial [Acidobacteria bacterium]|nr:hypothetical protein [Acidobacteriota bacterium]
MRLTGTRNPELRVSFKDAVLQSLPGERQGGGLFVPAELAPWPDAACLLDLPWAERCAEILARLLAPEYSRQEVAEIVREAFDFPVPLMPLASLVPPAPAAPPEAEPEPLDAWAVPEISE